MRSIHRRAFIVSAATLTFFRHLPAIAEPGSDQDQYQVTKTLGVNTVRILMNATRIEAFRVASTPAKDAPKQVDGFPIVSEAPAPAAAFGKGLAKQLHEPESLFSEQARCFLPGVAFRIWKEKQSVELLLCFQCTALRGIVRDAGGEELHRFSGGFRASFASWAALAKEAFPNGKDLADLQAPKD